MFFEVIPTEVFREGGGILTYQSDQKLTPGQVVLVPLGRRTISGIVLRQVKSVAFATKPISKLLLSTPIPSHLLKAAQWLSNYYLSPLPTCANLLLPSGLTSRNALGSAKSNTGEGNYSLSRPSATNGERDERSSARNDGPEQTCLERNNCPHTSISLNQYQRNALRALSEAPGATRLLRGVTGSGKTNIYLKMAENALQTQKSTILLVPEIALTSQLVQIFRQTFGERVVLIHSKQTLVERRDTWLKVLMATSGEPRANNDESWAREDIANSPEYFQAEPGQNHDPSVARDSILRGSPTPENSNPRSPQPLIIIGPRSALLTPVHNLGLIIIDESHENSYYQENAPRYSTLRLASFIASTLKIPCIQGTATPNIVDYHLAKTHSTLVELLEKAKASAITPEISIVDLKDRANFCKNRYFSDPLLQKIAANLQAGHQTLIFHNRRGSSPLTICENCGWQALCPECYLPMTLHADTYRLSCHICGHEETVPSSCPACGKPGIIHKGYGTKLLETELSRLFPEAKIGRFDGDNNKNTSLDKLYQEVKTGKIQILIGTQTLARGLDLPLLATVGIVQADSGLALPDFAAEERTFELLNQVIGRVGRGHLDHADVVVQTYQPDHPAITLALKSDFTGFADYLLARRRSQKLPPYTYLARLAITYKTEKTTLAKIRQAHQILRQNPQLAVSPPLPAFHERTSRGYTWQLTLKSTSRNALRAALLPFAKYHIELDPPSLL